MHKHIFVLIIAIVSTSNCFNVVKWINKLEKQSEYNKLKPPGHAQNKTTKVQVQLYMETLGNFKPQTMDFAADIYFIELWTDERLRHNQSSYIAVNDRAMIRRFWQPDTYFANSKSATITDVTVPNTVFKISGNGSIRYSSRISLKLSCNMNLKVFPMDRQVCLIRILTYSNTAHWVKVTWLDNYPVIINSAITEADFKIDRNRIDVDYCNATRLAGQKAAVNCLSARIHLKRYLGFSFTRTYVPSITIVFVSWISFWIDPESVPGRIALCITTLLAQATQAAASQFHLPPVGYAKAQDVWFGICVLLHFAALVEFAVVNMYVRRSAAAQKKMLLLQEKDDLLNRVFGEKDGSDIPLLNNHVIDGKAKFRRDRRIAVIIDLVSRLAFPISFTVLSIIYWCYYLTVSTQYE